MNKILQKEFIEYYESKDKWYNVSIRGINRDLLYKDKNGYMKKHNKHGCGYIGLNGKFHRIGMFCFTFNNVGRLANSKEWGFNGGLHRVNGIALDKVLKNKSCNYYLYGNAIRINIGMIVL